MKLIAFLGNIVKSILKTLWEFLKHILVIALALVFLAILLVLNISHSVSRPLHKTGNSYVIASFVVTGFLMLLEYFFILQPIYKLLRKHTLILALVYLVLLFSTTIIAVPRILDVLGL